MRSTFRLHPTLIGTAFAVLNQITSRNRPSRSDLLWPRCKLQELLNCTSKTLFQCWSPWPFLCFAELDPSAKRHDRISERPVFLMMQTNACVYFNGPRYLVRTSSAEVTRPGEMRWIKVYGCSRLSFLAFTNVNNACPNPKLQLSPHAPRRQHHYYVIKSILTRDFAHLEHQ